MSFNQSAFDVAWDLLDLWPRVVRDLFAAGVVVLTLTNPAFVMSQAQHQADRVVRPVMTELLRHVEELRPATPAPVATNG